MLSPLVALLLAADPALPQEPVQIHADEIVFEKEPGVSRAVGHAVLTTQGLLLHAPALTDDKRKGLVTVEGPLLAVDGMDALIARRALVHPATGEIEFLDFELHEKQQLSPAALAAAQTPEQARALGNDYAVVRGRRLVRVGPGHYRIDRVDLTTCQCTGDCRRAWSMAAKSADVVAGERAWLFWPALQIADVPLPVLRPPVLYLPLSDRRTGFLLPHVAWQVQNGFIVDEPFFLTLGRSYDLTLSAGYVFGASESGIPPPPMPAISTPGYGPGIAGVMGPRASAEFRYAPTPDTEGRLFASVLDDFNHDLPATLPARENPALADPSQDPSLDPFRRGLRESLHFWHLQGDEGPWGDRADVSLVSDARLTSQLTTDILYSSIPATRSAADAFYRGRDWFLSADAAYLQDFQGYFSGWNLHQELFGPGSPATMETLPRLQADLADEKLGPLPVWLSLSSMAAREGPLGPAYDRITLGPPTLPAPAGIGSLSISPWQFGRAAADKLDLFPTLDWPILANRFVTASLRASWREDFWYFESNPDPGGPSPGQEGQRGYPLLDAQLGSRLSRSFSGGWSHAIEPGVEARYIPAIETSGVIPPLWLVPATGLGGVPCRPPQPCILDHATGLPIASALPLPYDELDFAPGLGAAPTSGLPANGGVVLGTLPTSLSQGLLHIDQRLRGPGVTAQFDLGEYLDLAGAEASYGLLQSTWGPFHLNGYTLFSNQPVPCPPPFCTRATAEVRRLEQATGDLGWSDPRGDQVSLLFYRIVAAGSAVANAPADALFAPPLAATDPRWALPDVSQATAAGTVKVWDGISVHAGVSWLVTAQEPVQVTAGAGYRSPQKCINLDGTVVLQPPLPGQPLGFAAFFITFDLGDLGGGGGAL
ncbi:MAG: LPS-assembly protein LptD [Myxococcales bacterium]